MAAQSFHRFPDLPRELRDEIWRDCLPHRVVELDLADMLWFFDDGPPPCELWRTSSRNRHMPLITRVCRESLEIAYETGSLYMLPQQSTRSFNTDYRHFWLDKARDTLYLHWHKILLVPSTEVAADPLELLVKLSSRMPTAGITADLLDSIHRWERCQIMRLLQRRPTWSICGALVWIHATNKAAIIDSGLWGLLGEEPIVLVDASDAKRVAAFRQFWQRYGTDHDVGTEAFFEACVDDVPMIHYVETSEEYLQDLEVRWLHDCLMEDNDFSQLSHEVWLMTPEAFDGREDDPRQADYGDLPGRPFARQLWAPNRDHPWVQDILSKMPEFRPTVMFRLCTDDCPSKAQPIHEHGDVLEA